MKKTIAILLAVMMLVAAFSGCAKKDKEPEVVPETTAPVETVTPAEGEEAPAEGEEAPVEGEEAPAEGEEAPAEGEEAPVEGEAKPAA